MYRGAQPNKQGFIQLKNMGIKTIINLRSNHSDIEMLDGLDLQYVEIPMSVWSVDDKEVCQFLKIVTNHRNRPVFVHCKRGADRTGVMVAIYRVYVESWNKKMAIKELSNFGFWKGFKNLIKYLKRINIENLKLKVEELKDPEIDLIR